MLRRVELTSIDINYTHFLFIEKDMLISIEKNNLKQRITKKTFNITNKPGIYFASGVTNLLRSHDSWLKWKMNDYFGLTNLEKRCDTRKLSDYKHSWEQEFLSKEYINDEVKKEKIFSLYYHEMIDNIYLVLDISNGKEYDNLDYDEVKLRLLQDKDSLEYKLMREIYGEYSNMDSAIMEPWNRHTLKNVSIKAKDIRIVSNIDKTINALEVLKYFYDNYKDTKYDLLDDFMSYVNDLTCS